MEITFFKALAFAVCLIVGYYAYKKKAVNLSGLFSSVIFGAVVLLSFPLAMWLVPMLALFLAGSVSSKYKWSFKIKTGIAEKPSGRSAWNVIGNGGVAVASAVLYYFFQSEIFIYAYMASLASACADTVATEIGQLSSKRPLILPWFREVPTGTTGAVSVLGEIMALIGAFSIATIPVLYFGLLGVWNIKLLLSVIAAGFIGCQADSLIGSLTEPKDAEEQKENGTMLKIFNNHTTNLLSTLVAALLGAAFFIYI